MDEALKLVTDASLVESEWMLKTAATEVDRILQYHFVSPRFASFRSNGSAAGHGYNQHGLPLKRWTLFWLQLQGQTARKVGR